jgi:hypothetical protein
MWAEDVYHLALVKDDDMLVGCRVAQEYLFPMALGFGFPNGVLGKVRLVAAVTFVG